MTFIELSAFWFRKLNLLSVNVPSLENEREQREQHALFVLGCSDIVCCTESRVDSEQFAREIFLTAHDYFGKYKNKFGGEVFTGVKKIF